MKDKTKAKPEFRMVQPALDASGVVQEIISNASLRCAACRNPKLQKRLREIVSEWKDELKRLRKACTINVSGINKPGIRGDEALREALNVGRYDDDESKSLLVFRYFVGRSAKFGYPKWLKACALEEYARRQKLYDRLLGDAVPKKLRRSVSRDNYARNANATAREDQRAHWNLLLSADNGLRGLPTGIQSLDDKVGGLSGLTFLAGPTAVGKTSLAVDVVARVLADSPDVCVLFIELEINKTQLLTKFLSRESGVTYRAIVSRPWNSDVETKLTGARKRQRKHYARLKVIDRLHATCRGALVVEHIPRLVRQLLKTTRTRRCLVVVDSFDHTIPAQTTEHHSDSIEVLEDQSDSARMRILLDAQRRTRSQAMPDGFPFLVITRTRKTLAGDRVLVLSDVFGSVDLVYDASIVLLMQQYGDPISPGVARVMLDVAKVRDVGATGAVSLNFRHELSKFDIPTIQPVPDPRLPKGQARRQQAGRQ